MASQGRFYRICRHIVRLRFRKFRSMSEAEVSGAVIYICRHRNAIGPVSSLCLLPLGVRPWAFSAFTDSQACRDHLSNYTFPVTWKIPAHLSRLLGTIFGSVFAALVRSTGAIPVYRNSLKVRETFQKTIEALENGDRILIFPDINYAAEDGDTGALYEGFLLLERLWSRKTGDHIQFVPINVSISQKTLTTGKAIAFTGAMPYAEEKDIIVSQLENALNGMAREYGA